MDLNREYATHQQALMSAEAAIDPQERQRLLGQASQAAARISAFQLQLGAAASCAWSATLLATPATA